MKEKSLCLISLGCPKNLVDSEHLIALLKRAGFEITKDPHTSEKVVINTCGFIKDAVQESIDVILEISQQRAKSNLKGVLVYGCMVQRYGNSLPRLLPEVEAWFGVGQGKELLSYLMGNGGNVIRLKRPYPLDYLSSRMPATPPYMAYLKVSEGCDNKCTFCMIPKIRGRLRSYPLKDLVEEVRRLCGERDLKEIILIAQDLTQYGKDLGIESGLIRLLEELLRLNGPPWIRLMYLNPWGIEKGLISLIESEERLCPYLDVPIQHIDDSILTLMGRGGAKRVMEVLDLLRSTTRRVAIRTTLMVGFPTERDSSFKKLCDLVKKYRFDHLGAFIYSPEKGTKAARFTPRVRRDTAQRRYDKLMDLQREISRISNESLIGCEVEVLVEGAHPESVDLLVGRTQFMAPEIDGSVLINRGFARAGEFKRVKITEAYDYDLVGEIVG